MEIIKELLPQVAAYQYAEIDDLFAAAERKMKLHFSYY